MTRHVPLALLISIVATAQSPSGIRRESGYWVQTQESSVSGQGVQAVRVTTLGDLSVRGVDSDRVSFALKKKARAGGEAEVERGGFAALEPQAVRRGNLLDVRVAGATAPRVEVELSVSIPRRLLKADLKTQGGEIEIRSFGGEIEAASGGGRIDADEIAGAIRAETAGGEIRLGRIGGAVKCISGAGNIRVEHAGGEAWFETAGGEIFLGEARGKVHASTGGGNIHITRAADAVVARTNGGLIEVGEAGGAVIAETAGGAIVVQAAESVRCQSAAGAIRLKGVTGGLRAFTASGNIVAELPAGTEFNDSFLDTSFGDITVFIPSNLAVTVKAQNIRAGKGGAIVSDFSEVRVREKSRSVFEPVLVEGSINGGGPVLNLAAAGGTIYLRRRE